MTFLQKLGSILAKGLQIVLGVAPILQAVYPQASGAIGTAENDLNAIAQIVVEVEAVGQTLSLPGTQKLTAAAPLVAQVIMQSSLLVGRKIANQALFNQAASEIAGGMADLLNSLHDNVETTNIS